VRTALRLLVVVVFLAPLAFVLAGSLRRVGLPPPAGLELLPASPGLTAYDRLGELTPLSRLLRNSLLVVLVAVPVATVLASWAGFALAQLPQRSRRLLVGLTTALLLVPLPMLWIPRFVIYLELGLLDTLAPLIAPALAATTPFTVLLAYRAFRRVPPELWEAARLEGASALATWWRVGLPLVSATTTAIAAVAFVFHWGNYLDALLYAQSEATRTLPLGIGELATVDAADQSVLFAGAVVLALPAVLALLAVQRPLLGTQDRPQRTP
jgi:multiple sugar transport system permease protein